MALSRFISPILRLSQLIFAAIVAGITGWYLDHTRGASSWSQGRFIYTEVIAAISIFWALVWLIPFSGGFIKWPFDFVLSICWFVAFGLIVNRIGNSCGHIFDWSNIGFHGTCSRLKADEAFAFLSAIVWLASALVGLLWTESHERKHRVGNTTVGTGVPTQPVVQRRRKWWSHRGF